MRKSTEKKRLQRMRHDARRLFIAGLISGPALDKLEATLKTVQRKL